MRKIALLAMSVTLLMALVAACGDGSDSEPSPTSTAKPAPTPAAAPAAGGESEAGSNVVKVSNQDVGGSGKYQFVPAQFKFSVGETVTFSITGETEFHTFTVDDLNIDESVDGGKTVTFTHMFSKAGTFRLYCIPHEAFGMEAEIVVE